MKKILTAILAAGLGLNLYADNVLNKKQSFGQGIMKAKALYQCMMHMTPEQKKTVKEYAILSILYPDRSVRDILKLKREDVKRISTKAGEIFASLMSKTCKKETEDIFLKEPLAQAYYEYSIAINGVVQNILLENRDKRVVGEMKKWLEKGLFSSKQFNEFIHKVYLKKLKEERK